MTFPYDAVAQADPLHLARDPLVLGMIALALLGAGSIIALILMAVGKGIQLARIRRDARNIEREVRNLYGKRS